MNKVYHYSWMGLLGIIILISVGIATLALEDVQADSRFRQQDEVISTVNGADITVGEFQDRIRAERWYIAQEIQQLHIQSELFGGNFGEGQDPFQQQINILLGQLLDTDGFGDQLLQEMELQSVLAQEAERRGIVVDKNAIHAQIDDYTTRMTGRSLTTTPTLRPSPTRPPTSTYLPTPTITLTPTPTIAMTIRPSLTSLPTNTPLAPFEVEGTIEAYQEYLYATAESFGVTMEALTEIFYFQALRVAMREARFEELVESGDIRTQSLTATSRHILIAVPDSVNRSTATFDETLCESAEWEPYRQAAEAVLTRLENGEAFEDLAAELSDDVGTAARGGFVGEISDVDRFLVTPYAQAVHDADIGEYYGPVCTQFGFHIIQVLDKYWRDFSESELATARNEAYEPWTTELLLNATIERGEDWPQWIIGEPTLETMLGDIYEFDGNEMRQ